MSAFINTVDIIGDEALVDGIIDRSITEVSSDAVTTIGRSAFDSCSALTEANFPEVTTIGSSAFDGCSALTSVSLPKATTFGTAVFNGCSKLTTVNLPATYRVEDSTFLNCSALTTVNFPSITWIGRTAFKNCVALASVDLSKVKTVRSEAFYGCSNLVTVDLPVASSMEYQAFAYCSKLTTFILRSATKTKSVEAGIFSKTPIASGEGYIYVPAVLLESYKSDSVWKEYANQFRAIEDYPEICNPYSWEALASHLDAGDYATAYSVGDVIPLDLGDEGVINMQIAAFNADDLADGSGKAPISFVAQNPLATARRMNPALVTSTLGTGVIGGWDNSEMKSYLANTLKPTMPEAVRNRICAVTKTQRAINTSGTFETQTSTDEVWLPTKGEVSDDSGAYISLFPDRASRIVEKDGVATAWWLRDAGTAERFHYFDETGDWQYGKPEDARAVIIGFCIR